MSEDVHTDNQAGAIASGIHDAAACRDTSANASVDTSDLLDFVEAAPGDKTLRVEENLGEGFVRLRVGEAERRQAKHDIRCTEDIIVEMLRNARDAGATHIYLATTKDGSCRSIAMLDDGQGIPADMHERIFDARVTSKLDSVHMDRWGIHGRGMALYSIRENAQEARVMSSDTGLGTSLYIASDTNKLPERADQSTWPQLGIDDNNEQVLVRGPHNIIRECCEFALDTKHEVKLYLASPAEIIATIRHRIAADIDTSQFLFVDDLDKLPVLRRIYAAADALDLKQVAASLSLYISERTAHRILAGQIKPQRNVLAQLTRTSETSEPYEVDLCKDWRGLKVSKDDLEGFSRLLEKDFDFLTQRYYLTLCDTPKIRVSKNKISVTFTVDKTD